VITIGAVILGNGSENGVGAFLWAQNFLWLPVGLVAAPLATAVGPRLVSALGAGGDGESAGRRDSEGALILATTGLALSAALLVGLGWPATRLVAFGEAVKSGYAPLAHTLIAFGLGLLGTGLMFFVVRMLYSIDDARGAAVTTWILALFGILAMSIAADLATREDRAPALAVGFGVAHVLGAAIMLTRYARVSGWLRFRSCARPMAAALLAGTAACLVTLRLADAFPISRTGALGAIVVCAPVGAVVFGLLMRVLSGRRLGAIVHWERSVDV
jgi:putative peptidoglycan lipid II flippase